MDFSKILIDIDFIYEFTNMGISGMLDWIIIANVLQKALRRLRWLLIDLKGPVTKSLIITFYFHCYFDVFSLFVKIFAL